MPSMRGAQRFGSGREHESVVGLRVGVTGHEPAHADTVGLRVDGCHFLFRADVDAEAGCQSLHGLHEEFLAVTDDASNIIR